MTYQSPACFTNPLTIIVTDVYPTDNNYGIGGLSASFEMCDSAYETNLHDWKCAALTDKSEIELEWYSPRFNDSSWANAVEHDLVCYDGPFWSYEGTCVDAVCCVCIYMPAIDRSNE